MKNINDFDNFTTNPITAFKNAGYYRHRAGWNCIQATEHAVFFCVESGKMQIRTNDYNGVCNAGDTAFIRSFEIFPLYAVHIPLDKIVNLDYLVKTTSNVLYMGLQIASPVLLATLGQDIILGVISKTAPQVNVFQLSFLFKPVFGAAIMIWILPMLIGVISDFFLSFSSIY